MANKSLIQLDQLDDKKVDLIKRTVCKGASDDELKLFIHVCNHTNLDPFMKQIYAIKRGNIMTIQTSIDGLRLTAERTGNYSPGKEPTFTYDEKGKLQSATAYIKKRTSDNVWHEVAATAHLEEYNANQGLWSKMPKAMLAKCAEALALRKAFPADLSGIYADEEMNQADDPKKLEVELISHEQAMEIETAIGDDEDYRHTLLDFYRKNAIKYGWKHEIKTFEDIPNSALKAIWNGINKRNEKKNDELAEVL